MDEAQQKLIDERIATAVAAATKPLIEQIGQIAEANKKFGEFETNLKIVSDTVAKLPPANPDAIKKIVGETIRSQQADQAKLAAAAKAKGDWLAKNAPKLPETYRGLIPDTDDAATLEEAGKAALAKFESEFKASGQPVASAAAATTGGNAPAAGVGEAAVNGVSPAVAKYAQSIQLPGATK